MSCDGFRTDYGKSVAQFEEADLASQAADYRNKKVTVKGVVKSVDAENPKGSLVVLEEGLIANFGHLKAMAETNKPGETVMIDGILRTEANTIMLDPAIGRSPDASFDPTKR